jgi:NADH:ubiquinone oxidoreductase subunit 6 (subunit J)
MEVTQILFWFLSLLAIVAAAGVVLSKNPVYSVLWLIVVFFAISLFKEYVIPFELSSVLFLSAMIGAVVIGKKEQKPTIIDGN